jgi:hypothetical protein
MLGGRTNSKPEKSLKIRTLPTRPVHAVLDELLAIGIAFLIIVLNYRAVILKYKEGNHPLEKGEPEK